MIRRTQAALAALMLAACTPGAPEEPAAEVPVVAAPVAEAPPVAREGISEMHGATCTWGEVVSAGVSIWSYACPNLRLVADEALPGFQREETSADGAVMRVPVIQFFAKPADAPIGSVIEAVRAASPGSGACEIEPGSHGDHVLMPTGDTAKAYSRFLGGEASMPCGPLGPSEGGGRTFRVLPDVPETVIMIDWGTEPPVYDPDTMSAAN